VRTQMSMTTWFVLFDPPFLQDGQTCETCEGILKFLALRKRFQCSRLWIKIYDRNGGSWGVLFRRHGELTLSQRKNSNLMICKLNV